MLTLCLLLHLLLLHLHACGSSDMARRLAEAEDALAAERARSDEALAAAEFLRLREVPPPPRRARIEAL